jgi:hypothetical protein
MALKYTVDDLESVPESVPEALRSEYEEHEADGKKTYRLALELPENYAVENVRGLKLTIEIYRTIRI